jgi:hypothetical protein
MPRIDENRLDSFDKVDSCLISNSQKKYIDQEEDNISDCLVSKEASLPSVEETDIHDIVARKVENPGNGDCAFYAFAIGLIHIIKHEFGCKKTTIFDNWSELDKNIKQYYMPIVKSDVNNIMQNLNLLNPLQRSLRNILFESQIKKLQDVCVHPGKNNQNLIADDNYNLFASLYYDNIESNNCNKLYQYEDFDIKDDDCNKFYQCKDIERILSEEFATIRKSASEDKTPELIQLFLRLLYGKNKQPITRDTPIPEDSLIKKAISTIKTDGVWGTAKDLAILAEIFNVNLNIITNGIIPSYPFINIPDRHTIIINNDGNMHWNTGIEVAWSKDDQLFPMFLSESKFSIARKIRSQARSSTGHNHVIDNSKSNTSNLDIKNVNGKFSRLIELGQKVEQANIDYQTYSNNIWFSLFHRHGASGRARANKFTQTFSELINKLAVSDENEIHAYNEAITVLYNFLNNRQDNGNTNPHSFKTMCLKELFEFRPPSLEQISTDYDFHLDCFKEQTLYLNNTHDLSMI